MLSFEDLPNDVLLEIAEILLCYRENLCQLRLASRRLSIIVSPILFRRLVIRICNYKTEELTSLDESSGCRIISAIASRSTTVYEHTKELLLHTKTSTILRSKRNLELEFKRKVIDKIFDVISMCKNLRGFGYVSDPQDYPENFHSEVIRALGTLPLFKAINFFHFTGDPPPSFTLEPLSNLTKFVGSWLFEAPHFTSEIAALLPRCPNLIELRLRSVLCRVVTLKDIFCETGKMEKALELKELRLHRLVVSHEDFKLYARHFKNLTSITITGNKSPSASTDLGEICNILLQSETYLEQVSSDHPEDLLLFFYLSSYTGLKRLVLTTSSGEGETRPEAVNMFYTQVLPKQSEVLEELRLCIYESGAWCQAPTEDQLAGLSKCRKLRTLVAPSAFTYQCELNARAIWEPWFKVGSQLPDLEYMSILLGDTYSSEMNNVVMRSWYAAREELKVEYQQEKGIKFTVP